MTIWDRVSTVLEYGLAALFIRSAIVVFLFSEPAAQIPRFLTLLAGQEAIYAYAIFFGVLGLSLLYAKVFKKLTLKKWCILVMFLVSVYMSTLVLLLSGFTVGLWLPIFAIFLTGALYIRLKLQTEYITTQEFYEVLIELKSEDKDERN